jgi:hypothetical protein
MKNLLLTAALVWMMIAPTAWSAPQDQSSVGPEAVRAVLARQTTTGNAVVELITGEGEKTFGVIRLALIERPEDVVDIVTSAMLSGATTEDMARQCDGQANPQIIPDLVSTAVSLDADASTMTRRCLNAVATGDARDVIEAALQYADPAELEGILLAALNYFDAAGIEGKDLLVSSLVAGELLAFENLPANCDAACLEPIAETWVEYLSEQTGVEPAEEPLLPAEAFEPALSGS